MRVREYCQATDEEWMRRYLVARGQGEDAIAHASPYGVTVENEDGVPMAMIYLYLSIGCGVAYAHELVMAPNVTVREARELGRRLVEGIRVVCEIYDYGVVHTTVQRKGLARELGKLGWMHEPERWYQQVLIIN